MLSLAGAKRVIVIGGCLGTAFIQLTQCPIAVQWARSLGADGLHVGILGAVPTGFLFMQLAAAMIARRLTYRKPLWLAVSLVQRVMFLPVALGPWIWPAAPPGLWIWVLLSLAAANHALLHFSTPLWLSWMSDYLPHAGLSRFWGVRQFWLHWAAAGSLLLAGVCLFKTGLTIRDGFAWMMIAASVAGVLDVLFFLPVEEPPARHGPEPRLRDVLAGPFQRPDFRSYISFSCFWHVAAMVGAPFISLFLFEHIGMDLFHVMLLWAFSWTGGTFLSRRMGNLAERCGGRPLLILCTAFKSLNMIALLCLPRDPVMAFWVLIPVFMIDAMLNAGIAIAHNNFLMKNSPAENRTMFIAAGTAYAGFTGGLASIAAGLLIRYSKSWHAEWLGMDIVNYHVLFAVSTALRFAAAAAAIRVREPASHGTRHVLTAIMSATPLRYLAWPWRRSRAKEGEDWVVRLPVAEETPLECTPSVANRAA